MVTKSNFISEDTIVRLQKGDRSVLISCTSNIMATPKVLSVDPQKCDGCRLCETACSLYHFGEVDPLMSRIHILEWSQGEIYLPVLCQHCSSAPCKTVCPKDAISWQDDWGRVVIDYDRCVSCQMCLAACPYGAIRFDNKREIVIKCDLCNGNPQCVSFCQPGALKFMDADMINYPRARQSAWIRGRF